MKTIVLVRHAKSSWDHINLKDHDRPLNARGLRDAPRMANWLSNSKYNPSSLIVSSAKRAQETAHEFQIASEISSNEFVTEPELYHAGMKEWITVLERFWLKEGTTAFFAHNPGITNVINWLCDENIFNVPTCGTAVIGFPQDLNRIDSGVGQLLEYKIPKAMD